MITTASPHNHLHVRELGADEVFDYKLHNVVGHIKKAAPILEYVFDTIGSETSSVLASQTITQHSAEARRGKLCTVRPDRAHTEKCAEGVEVRDVLVWTAFLRNNKYGELEWPVSYVYNPSYESRATSPLGGETKRCAVAFWSQAL